MGIPHIAVGDLLRAEMEKKTELGCAASAFMEKGELVPDSIALQMLLDRLNRADCKEGAILDGTSRKRSQAEFLLSHLPEGKTLAIYFDMASESLVTRILGRKTCLDCGASYHFESHPETTQGECNRCRGALVKRKDDTAEVLAQRVKVFQTNIGPVLDFYSERQLLHRIDANQPISQVFEEIESALNSRR